MTSNLTHCTQVNLDFTKNFLSTVFSAVFVFGLLANCWGLKSMCTKWTKLGNINIFALNLCMADIFYLLTLPFLVAYYAKNQTWMFGQPFCKITRFLFNVNLYGSIGFLTCISVYRYLGIVHTLKIKGRITERHSVGITVLVWFLVVLQSLPDVFFKKTDDRLKCFDTAGNDSIDHYMKYSLIQTVTGFVIPLVIILCCYGHVAVTLANKKDAGDAMLRIKCFRLVLILALLFSICFIPFHILRNLNLMTRVLKNNGICKSWFGQVYIARQISGGLACLNSVINPLAYLLNSDELLMSWLRQLHERSEQAAEVLQSKL
ncbi:P2Y purinoceptor 1 [Trichomycterus rosablanca]|uniref:P2Y purinoceptor 1 n=1 Tax=Trichomycterus rosablanca TaxID=2290929 RepID=UPI002F35AEE0